MCTSLGLPTFGISVLLRVLGSLYRDVGMQGDGQTHRGVILASNLEGALKTFVSLFIVVKTARTPQVVSRVVPPYSSPRGISS
jgi:hypothetical protein